MDKSNCQSKLFSLSENEVISEFMKFDERSSKDLYLQVLLGIVEAISRSDFAHFQKLCNLIDNINSKISTTVLKDFYDDNENPIKDTNLIIISCKHNEVNILTFMFSNSNKILDNLSVNIGRGVIRPTDEDDMHHNPFYYAIRSGNTLLLDVLIRKWPGDYFVKNAGELDLILSKAYEELKLKNILLSEGMECFVEINLINLRFFSNSCMQNQNVKCSVRKVKERIDLVLHGVNLLRYESMDGYSVDEKFLFISKFIAQNIHVLKRQLKSTYVSLPWEEMEFILVSFVFSHTKPQEINLYYQVALTKSKLLKYLEYFAKELVNLKETLDCVNKMDHAELPKLEREKVIANIIRNCPQFEALYSDYKQIMDVHSLQKINDYIKLALSVDPNEKEGRLIIVRVLQIIGEYLKNTLESPRLSRATCELLLLTLPKKTRGVIIGLRNSLSHSDSLSKRIELEENTDPNFFIGVQNDTRKIGGVIANILYNNKIKTINILLKKIINSVNLDEIREVALAFNNAKLDRIIPENFVTNEVEHVKKLITELSTSVKDKNTHELVNKINEVIGNIEKQTENIIIDYVTGFATLNSLTFDLRSEKMDDNYVKSMKFRAGKTLENISPQNVSHNLKGISELLNQLVNSVELRLEGDNLENVKRLIYEIFYIIEVETDDIKWIEDLRVKLNQSDSFKPTYRQRKSCNIIDKKNNNQLHLKLSELKSLLMKNEFSGHLEENVPIFKSNKKLQAVVEMLVLDIMSILGSSKNYLENNLFFVDDNTPLLTGKCLRNHLAHDNALFAVLLTDPSTAVILNAKKLISENVLGGKKKVGKLVLDNPSKLRDKFEQGLNTIINQNRMFDALVQGNLEDLQRFLKKGADINARSINCWTAMHFAAKGQSIEIIKFLVNQNLEFNVKDINGENPLHIAAALGRENIVKFFVEELGSYVDDQNDHGKTPLHISARNGHEGVVKVLLKNKANTVIYDMRGLPPLFYGIKNNHKNVIKLLLEKETNVDVNQAAGGFTSLNAAAENGHLELVNILLKKNANVNFGNDRGWAPLHAASYNGHLEIVKALIAKGANVNASVINGCTPLLYAVENGSEDIVNVLLESGANVDAIDKTNNNSILHVAAKDGHKGIVRMLLKNKAKAKITNLRNITPLHLAANNGHMGIVIDLIQHGVDIDAKDINNATPLFYAVTSGHEEVAKFLIKNKAEINVRDCNNSTPLHIAATNGHKDIVELLIKNKAGVNIQDIKGNTPLHVAAVNGNTDIVDFLLKNKAVVNAKNYEGLTPLHCFAFHGHVNATKMLINYKADVNIRAGYGGTPLHAAVVGNHKNIVDLLLKNKAMVDARGIDNSTALHLAVDGGLKEIVQILIANGAKVNVEGKPNITPLISAIRCNNKEIVKILIANGCNVNGKESEPLMLAVAAGYKDIVEMLLKNKARINIKQFGGDTLLHIAASRGHKDIVSTLIVSGINVNAKNILGTTPLHIAAKEGFEEVVEILIKNKANVNVVNGEGAPIHRAAGHGYYNIVKLLIDNGAIFDMKDTDNRTALELAVAYSHLEIVKLLLNHKKVNINAKGNDDWTLLHIASQTSDLEIVKYLVNKGADVNAKNTSGSKPIHIAAREGFKDTVQFFLSKGLSVNEFGASNQSLLHYAAMKGQLDVVQYLIAQDADVNAKDAVGMTPMHIAAIFNYKNIIEVLLKNRAFYNSVDLNFKKPLDLATYKITTNLLISTEKLFEAVKSNKLDDVEYYIKRGAFVNAISSGNESPLHYATWKGYNKVVSLLLQNNADPNIIVKGVAPLHYASKFSHFKIVIALLCHGAIYNAVSNGGKTPLQFASDKIIANLLALVGESFKNVKSDNYKVINILNNIKNFDKIKAIMNACDRENKTLLVVAMQANFSKIEQLKNILQNDVIGEIQTASMLHNQGNHEEALKIFNRVFEKRKDILGSENPATLDIQTYIAKVLYAQGKYQEALIILEEIFQKQIKILGNNDENTLNTRSIIATVLTTQGNCEEAFHIYQEVYQKQKEILGSDHLDTLTTQFEMALALDKQQKYEEAFQINKFVFEKLKKNPGDNNQFIVRVQNNIGMVLANQGKYEEALKIYREVLEKKKLVIGVRHADTLRTQQNIAGVLFSQKKYNESLKAHVEVLNAQRNYLGPNHPDTLITQYNMGHVLYAQSKWTGAFKAYRECYEQMKAIFGPTHSSVLDISNKIEEINRIFKLQGINASEVIQHLQGDIHIASSNGDISLIMCLIKSGTNVNSKDLDGNTPLHYAVSNGHLNVVNTLLENGADVTQITNKGNTPLHIATLKCYKEIVEVLLKHVDKDNLSKFINAKTTATGSTALHVASKNGYIEIIKKLLKFRAIYNRKNMEGKTPADVSKDWKVKNLFKLIEELFKCSKDGDTEIIKKLTSITEDEFAAATNACNNQENNLLQVAIGNGHKNIAVKLLGMLKMKN